MNRPKPTRIALIAAVVVAVVLVGGFFIVRLIQGPSKPPLALSTVTPTPTSKAGATASTQAGSSATSGTGAVAVDGVWNVKSGSQAGYRIKETLFGQSATAVGRTTAVTGNISIAGTTVTAGSFTVDMTKVSSDRSQRDNQFEGRIMNTSTYPTSTFTLTQPIQLSTLPANGVQVTAHATGDLMLHGVTKSVSFQVTAERSGSTIQVVGTIPITFADWNISNPSGGPATTADNGSLEFLISFVHS